MKIVQTVLREADRNRLLDALACDILYDTQLLLELQNRSIVDIQEAYRNHMNTLLNTCYHWMQHRQIIWSCICAKHHRLRKPIIMRIKHSI